MQVIYDLINDVKAAMEGKLRSVDERLPLGKAEVKAVFGTGARELSSLRMRCDSPCKGAGQLSTSCTCCRWL